MGHLGGAVTVVQPELWPMLLGCCAAHSLFWDTWQGRSIVKIIFIQLVLLTY